MWKSVLLIASFALATSKTVAAYDSDFGILLRMDEDGIGFWSGEKQELNDSELVNAMLQEADENNISGSRTEQAENLRQNMDYIKTVFSETERQHFAHGSSEGAGDNAMFKIGVTLRMLLSPPRDNVIMQVSQAAGMVRNQIEGTKTLVANSRRRLQSVSDSLNWCSDKNSKSRNICSPVKNQRQCGSCWAFSAADTIEAAASYSSGNSSIPISTQQFLECSTNKASSKFDYCWADSDISKSASWMKDAIIWSTTNDHCDGGMPFAAFNYAIQSPVGIVSAAELPYKDGQGSSSGSCPITSNSVGAAFITGWEQVKGSKCSSGGAGMKDTLKEALQNGPISTAIATNAGFDMYKGGVYTCQNNGDLPSQSSINHAITLVGYTDDYWIIKNSYGSGWGENGYLHLAMDEKLNCGLSVFPVMVKGAQQGDRSKLPDVGSDEYDDSDKILGMSKKFWIWGGVGAGIVVILAIIAGIVQRKRQERLQRQYTQQLHQPFQVDPTYNQGY